MESFLQSILARNFTTFKKLLAYHCQQRDDALPKQVRKFYDLVSKYFIAESNSWVWGIEDKLHGEQEYELWIKVIQKI